MSNDLIERLRLSNPKGIFGKDMHEAADALKAKDQEIELLEKGYDALLDDRNEAWERVAELEAALQLIAGYADPDFPADDWQGEAERSMNAYMWMRHIAHQTLGEKE